jgi:hypothetical protein
MTIQEEVAEFRNDLEHIQERAKDLRERGVILTLTISSEQKTVEVKSASQLEISCKATINQEL